MKLHSFFKGTVEVESDGDSAQGVRPGPDGWWHDDLCHGSDGYGSPGPGGARAHGQSGMISFPTSARIVVAAKPVDFRRGGESLAALAREVLKEDPFAGVVVIFRSRRADRVTIIARAQTGLGVGRK